VAGSAVLDVVLGLSFLFFVLSLACATLIEITAAARGWRGRTLAEGIAVLLDGSAEADRIYDHPLIKSLYRANRRPSYIPARRFAQAVLDLYVPDLLTSERAPDFSTVPSLRTREALTLLWQNSCGNVSAFQADVAQWFDDTMKRTSGWYRRRADVRLVCLASALTIVLNVNPVTVSHRLWADAPVRAAIASTDLAPDPAIQDPAHTHDRVKQLKDEYAGLEASRLPLGWSRQARPHPWWLAVVGWPLSVLAISLGAPFWFDLLGKVTSVRAAGKREDPK